MDQWAQLSQRYHEWTPPLIPSREDVEMYRNQLKGRERTLLLGVTPTLIPLASAAVDHNPRIIEMIHPDAILGDWGDLPFGSDFDAVIGDGCLTVFQGTSAAFFQQVKKVLKKGGRLVMRTFIAPESKRDLRDVLKEKETTGFHAFKWKVAHTLANPHISVKDLYRAIKPIYDHPTLDVYKDSDLVYYFPKLTELPAWSHIQFGSSYELAELCPVITWDF
jgi:SAM-dependent methyltransferase